MQESQKALLKYLSDALVCSSSSGSSLKTTSTSTAVIDDREARSGSVDEHDVATTLDTTTAEAVDNSIIRNEAIAQSVYSLIGTEADVFYIISKNVQILRAGTTFHGSPWHSLCRSERSCRSNLLS